jgi:amidase
MTELHDLTALEQARAIRTREISAVELTEHYLRRCDARGDELGVFLARTDDLARDQAAAADARVAAADPDEDLGPLFGTVVPPKGLDLVAGVTTNFGSDAIALTPPVDGDAVALMRAAGLVFPGITNTPEFGLPCYTENPVAPPARTPWDTRRSAGGSSGGAAAAVSAGLASAAQGSDGGGSIRIPASVTGLVGIKPSRYRVSGGPLPDGVGELAVIGPLARTVRDAAALLDVLAGSFAGAPTLLPAVEGTFLDAAGREPGRLRIGRYATPVIAEAVVDAECLAAYDAASALLESLGHTVEEIAPPWDPSMVGAFVAVWSTLALGIPIPEADEPRLTPLTRWLRHTGRGVSGLDLANAVSSMQSLTRDSLVATAGYDVVLTPTLAQVPSLVGGIRDDADPAADFEAQKRFTPFTSPYNVTGQPAVSLPLHWAEVGGVTLPIGVQLVGRPADEVTLLSLAAQLEAAAPWAGRRPPGW